MFLIRLCGPVTARGGLQVDLGRPWRCNVAAVCWHGGAEVGLHPHGQAGLLVACLMTAGRARCATTSTTSAMAASRTRWTLSQAPSHLTRVRSTAVGGRSLRGAYPADMCIHRILAHSRIVDHMYARGKLCSTCILMEVAIKADACHRGPCTMPAIRQHALARVRLAGSCFSSVNLCGLLSRTDDGDKCSITVLFFND